jgi:hypothetical protein
MAVFDRRDDGGLGSNQQYQKLIAAMADTVAPTPTPTPSRRMVDRTAVLSACSTSKDGCSYTSKIRIIVMSNEVGKVGSRVTATL